jgi:hypothetical protein
MRAVILIAMIVLGAVGCAPRVRVLAHPQVNDPGIRYYRPKPYLLVSNVAQVVAENGKPTRAVLDEHYVQIQLQYLPDYSEEYAIDVRSGLGIADVSITLTDGWNLTGINQKLDSQTDESLRAMAEILGSASDIASANARIADPNKSAPTPEFRVKATNVPLGYYESVIGQDACGKKRLYGFRYVGFLPYQACPVSLAGMEFGSCETTEIYGLVFENGTMVFRPLPRIEALTEPEDIVEPIPPGPAARTNANRTFSSSSGRVDLDRGRGGSFTARRRALAATADPPPPRATLPAGPD